jgi:polysaccharide export outer membrane protein
MAPTTVLQLISMTGGLQEYADSKNITIIRNENGKPVTYRFNYKDVVRQRKRQAEHRAEAGDTIVIP